MLSRFVILQHEIDGGEHWDLMLERGQVLATWQLLRDPSAARCLPLPARRIGDHQSVLREHLERSKADGPGRDGEGDRARGGHTDAKAREAPRTHGDKYFCDVSGAYAVPAAQSVDGR